MSRKGNDLTKSQLEELGFTLCEYDANSNTWHIKRSWFYCGTNKKKEYDMTIALTDDKHPYGDDRSEPIISFSTPTKKYSISLPRFVWAWTYGSISGEKKVRRLDPNSLDINTFELRDWKDHSYYKKANTVLIIREMIDGIRPFKF